MRNKQTNIKTYDDELLFDVKKKRNLTSNKWCDEKLSSFDDYFQNNENIGKMIHQNESIVDVFADQKSTVLRKFVGEKI